MLPLAQMLCRVTFFIGEEVSMLRCELKEGRPRRWFDPPSGNFGLLSYAAIQYRGRALG